jgi:arginine/lysine/ornithine decarboxylase
VRANTLINWVWRGVTVLFLSAFCSLAAAAEFSADMTMVNGGDTTTYKLYVKGLKYRMETIEDGQEIVIIVDQEANLTRVANVNVKAYIEMPSNDIRSLMNDPFQALKITIDTPGIERNSLGTETVNGIECDKYALLVEGKEFYTYCMSRKYNFPVKIIVSQSERVVELKNIKESAVDDRLFEIPEGFSPME